MKADESNKMIIREERDVARIKFPRQATVGYIDNFLRCVKEIRELKTGQLILDFYQTVEMSSLAMCFLSGLVDLANELGIYGRVVLPRNQRCAKAIRLLRSFITSRGGRPRIKIAEKMLQVRKIQGNNSAYIQEMIDLVGYNLDLPPKTKYSIIILLNELLTNAIDHSGESACYVCVGAWGRSKNFHMALLDFGQGIPNSVRKKIGGGQKDCKVVQEVLEKGITTRRDRVGGEGYKLIQNALKANEGRLHIFSQKAKVIFKYDRREYYFREARSAFNGTCVDVQYCLTGQNLFEYLPEVSEAVF